MTKNMRFLNPVYLFWAIVWNKWNPLFSGAKIENLNKNLDPGHVFVFSGSKKYFPQHYHSSLQNIDILQRQVNFAPFQKNHFQGYVYFKCALISNANACIHNGYLCTTWDCPKICTKSTFPVVVILEDVISVQRRWILEGENGIVQEGFGGNWLQRQSHNPITFCNNSFAIAVVPPLSPLHFYGQTIPNPYFKRANPFS